MTYPTYPQYQQYQQPYQPYQDRMAQMPAQYQVGQPAQPMQPVPQPQAINQGLLWVQGEAGAKSYLVAPNTTVLLMDSEGSRFYLKSTDNAGMPTMRTFEYREVPQNVPQAPQATPNDFDDKYVTREEYDGLRRQYEEILDKLNSFPVLSGDKRQTEGATPTSSGRRSKGGNDNE